MSSSRSEQEIAGEKPSKLSFGSSVYGGRPTFALVRKEGSNGGILTLYELLPEEQATARKERLERTNRALVIEQLDDVLVDSDNFQKSWSWDDWVMVKIARLSGSHIRAVIPVVRESLSSIDVDGSIVTGNGEGDEFIPETVGVRLALTFAGIKPIQRVDRMRAFTRGIARMSDEECYYWHAKCRSPSSPNGKKALRALLTAHIE